MNASHPSQAAQAANASATASCRPRGRALCAATLMTLLPFVAEAQSTVLHTETFEPVQAAGWNAMTPVEGAFTGVVWKTNTPGTGSAYRLNGYGGGAPGWAMNSSAVLEGSTSDWTLQGKAKWLKSNYGPNPWYGAGGLVLSSVNNGMGGDYIWVGYVHVDGEWSRSSVEWKLGGVTGGGILYPDSTWPGGVTTTLDSWGAIRDMPASTLRQHYPGWGATNPAGLTLSRTGGSATLTFLLDSPIDGPRTATITFTGAAATALDTLKHVGFANYLSEWEYDDLVVKNGNSDPLYATGFEPASGAHWNTMTREAGAIWSVTQTDRFANGLYAYQGNATNGSASGWALYSVPVLDGSTSNWTVTTDTKWIDSNYYPGDPPTKNPYYGVGGVLFASSPDMATAGDWLWVGYARGDYDNTGKSWSLPFMQYNLGGVTGSMPVTGPAFRDFPEHAPIGLRVSRVDGTNTITLSITSPLDGPVNRSLTFTGDQAAALDGLKYVGLMNYFSAWQYDNLKVAKPGQYELWALDYNLDPESSSGPGAGAPAADPDGDGFPNSSEYAFGTHPTEGNGALVQSASGAGESTFSWLQRTDGAVTYKVWESPDLSSGSWVLSALVPQAGGGTPPGGYEWKKIVVPTTGGGRMFFRVTGTF